MIASLPMYDRPETAAANDRFWTSIRHHLGEGPDALTRGGDLLAQWQARDLIFSQTCGYPYRAQLHGDVTLIGTPDYGLPGCPPGHYNSVIVVHKDASGAHLADFEHARFAYNEALSQSGWAGPQTHARAQGLTFRNLVQTSGHLLSAQAVAEGRADIAGIDALTWELLQRYEAFASALRVLERTAPTPVLPYITAKGRDGAAHFDAVSNAIHDLAPEDRTRLHLKALVAIPAEAYLAVPSPPSPSDVALKP
ncbi:MAG: phosphate/phosphite/phosphonate ABC transporter substrate-binding protein [Roseovarius sp.]